MAKSYEKNSLIKKIVFEDVLFFLDTRFFPGISLISSMAYNCMCASQLFPTINKISQYTEKIFSIKKSIIHFFISDSTLTSIILLISLQIFEFLSLYSVLNRNKSAGKQTFDKIRHRSFCGYLVICLV